MILKRALERLDRILTTLEVAVCLVASAALMVSLTLWASLKGLAARSTDANQAGLVFRSLAGALLLGILARLASRRLSSKARASVVIAAAVVGALASWLWRDLGLDWGGNLLGWLQDGSAFTLLGGLRGFGTRLTLVLVFAGGALATGAGRHVTIDVIARAMPARLRRPLAAIGGLLAAAVCLSCAWGFADFIAVDTFRAPAGAPATEKIATLARGARRHAFLLRRQLALDARMALPVLAGQPWDRTLGGARWNAWLDAGDWSAHFTADEVAALRASDDSPRTPLVATPAGEAVRGLLTHSMNLVVPLGLLWLSLRFLLFCLRGAREEEREGPVLAGKRSWIAPSLLGAAGAIAGGLGGVVVAAVTIAALVGAPLFAVIGGTAELGWLSQGSPLRLVAPRVLEEQFAGSPVLVTIPLFTLLGYLLAESRAKERIVTAARAWLGWLPGGLAVVCLFASAFFTTLTGGSGVTIVAVGGLLLPALEREGYPERFSLGLVTSGGSLGLLLPPSLAILVYALVAGLDFNAAFLAGLLPGALVLVVLSAYSVWVGARAGIPRQPLNLGAMGRALWLAKWELGIPVLLLASLGTGLASLDESAALAVLYALLVELLVHRDLSPRRDLARVLRQSMALSGAVILILLMANALMNLVIDRQIPSHLLEGLAAVGLTERWQFLLALNLFLLVLGMVMDGFSAIIVAVPLVVPFAARFGLNPFHLAMMVILNLELAFCMPPLGLNLFISSFRFRRPLMLLYRSSLPFVGLLAICLATVMALPWLSSALVQPQADAARAAAAKLSEPPAEAWKLECVQEDFTHPQPCSQAERARWAHPADTGDEDGALFEQMMKGR